MTLLENHLEQIALSASAIADLPFPQPKIFTNALLSSHDITALIRDTESYERALFSAPPPSKSQRRMTRRSTMFPAEGDGESMISRIHSARNPRKQSAVARVLGGDMMDEIKKSSNASYSSLNGRQRGEINVEVLLRGAEKLCNVYPIAGAPEKIASLRYRHRQVAETVAHLEARVADQAAQLERMNKSIDFSDDDEKDMDNEVVEITDEMIEQERQEIRELEMRKQTLEARVSGMERDLGGLMR